MRHVLLSAVLGACVAPSTAIWSYGPESFNCKMRGLAYEYGKKTLPKYGQFEALYYALGLNKDCTEYVKPPHFQPSDLTPPPPLFNTSDAVQLYVDYTKGSDANPGTLERPMKTIQVAVNTVRGRKATINLRAGTHYLTETVQITRDNNGLTIQNYNGELAVVSGGKKVNAQWSPYKVSATQNMYVARLLDIEDAPGFQVNGVRVTRARYPNGNVELPERTVEAGDPNGVAMINADDGLWTPPDLSKQGTQRYVTNNNPAQMRNFTTYGFQKYMVGIGGPCDIYDPPVAYWCADAVKGGGAFAFRVPRGVTPKSSAIAPAGGGPDAGLHMPYRNPEGAIINVWRPARWANWMFELGKYDTHTNNITFGKGGFQGARGDNVGSDWFVENVFEEFDAPNEFFFDKQTRLMYYYHNATGKPPADAEYVVPQIKTLFNLTAATRWEPIQDVTIRGLKMTATRITYMEPHGVPSGGDWGVARMGAVFLQGTERCVIDSNFLTRLDGNGVLVSGYNRNTKISNNEFAWIGTSAMVAWGFTNETGANPLEGFDATDGNHPRFTLVENNVVRELGHYEKQSSAWFQGKVSETTLKNNIFFNGPRAAINFNDGLGGGDIVAGNLVFSMVRESIDNGPLNSWDRQPFLSAVRTGEPSVQMQWRQVYNNFFINNYHLQESMDTDDGSAYYHTHDNVLMSGLVGMKNDYGGHDNMHYNNLYAYVQTGFRICSQLEGHVDGFYNNTLVMTDTEIGSGEGCSGPGKTIVHDLDVFTPSGKATECGKTPPQSPGTHVSKLPTDEFIVNLARTKLGM